MEGTEGAVQEQETAASVPTAAPVAMKQRRNRSNLRKRDTDDVGLAVDEDNTAVIRKAKQQRGDPLSFSTKKDDKQDVGMSYASTNAAIAAKDESATRALETETQFDRDARAQRERLLAASAAGPTASDGKYRGQNAYIDYKQGLRREGHTVGAEKGSGSHGPLRGNMFVRTTARFDYQPDICKDYKETGFCSYGDSCKFLHDRGDYKSGWELEAEWEVEQKRRQEALTKGWGPGDEDDGEQGEAIEDDDLPFACFICRQPWHECKGEPVMTKCRHYFCESCALKRNAKNGKCAACDTPTQGIFNVATDVMKKMKKAGAAAEKAAEAAADGGTGN